MNCTSPKRKCSKKTESKIKKKIIKGVLDCAKDLGPVCVDDPMGAT